ncbi:MAG: hypothetical protein LBT63_03495 [Holosporaceae bacterium]|jgi:hypothetical protein|nr:hypothetical protein [Holosporaceae bacterium]
MLPWDMGIINAIKKELKWPIFPSKPPEELRKTPHIIFELQNVLQGKNLMSRVEFLVTIVDRDEVTGAAFEVLRAINKIISKELTLFQENCAIGSAKIKINSIASKENSLILNLVAILQLKAIYEDQ